MHSNEGIHEVGGLQGSRPFPHPQKTLKMDILLLGSHSSGGSDDSDFPSAPRIDPPRAQCSCTDG
jgi:hypothetical protein